VTIECGGCGAGYSAARFSALPLERRIDETLEVVELRWCECGVQIATVTSLSPRGIAVEREAFAQGGA
jgi:hypothetical protein